MKIVLDPGSTHMGKSAYAKELVDIAHDCGADYVKFQLFPNLPEYTSGGNVPLSRDLFKELFGYVQQRKYKMGLTASVFTKEDLDFLVGFPVPFVKVAHSRRTQKSWIDGCLHTGRKVVVSMDYSDHYNRSPHPALVRLFCIPKYPVVEKIHFEEIFPRFDGFSDHTLGWEQTIEAVARGAEWIEKHITLEYDDVRCPDRAFALNAKKAAEMIQEIRKIR